MESRDDVPAPLIPTDPQLEALKALAGPGCYLCKLDEIEAEDWD